METLSASTLRISKRWRECWRVLHPGGRIAINIGDQYVQSDPEQDRPYHVVPLSARVPLTAIDAGREYDGPNGLYLGHIVWRKFTNQRTRVGRR
jgi:site-specific DNA-methyltransferase (adenine-specific)